MTNEITQAKRTVPWLGVGMQGEWETSLQALTDAELDFNVRQEKLYWMREDNGVVYNEQAPMFGNVRNTDDKLLGCVTPQYKIIQNRDAFALLDPFVQNNDGVITNVGMTEDGLVFMVARVKVGGGYKIGGEPYEINLMATNSFNTKYPCQIIFTPVRIYCQNMYRKLTNDRVFMAKHTTTANDRLIKIAQGDVVEQKVETFQTIVESYQREPMSSFQLKSLLSLLFPYPKEGGSREEAYRLKADEARERFIDQYFDASDNQVHKNTMFGFVNAYFDYLSHRPAMRDTATSWADRRLAGLVSGNDVNSAVLRAAWK